MALPTTLIHVTVRRVLSLANGLPFMCFYLYTMHISAGSLFSLEHAIVV